MRICANTGMIIFTPREIAPKDDGLGLHALLSLPLSRITKYDNALEVRTKERLARTHIGIVSLIVSFLFFFSF